MLVGGESARDEKSEKTRPPKKRSLSHPEERLRKRNSRPSKAGTAARTSSTTCTRVSRFFRRERRETRRERDPDEKNDDNEKKIETSVNVQLGPREERLLITGLHTVADISCAGCASVLGWKYVSAYEESQRYKEGRFIVEKAKVVKADGDW